MTEADWFDSTNPAMMLDSLEGIDNCRKLRLFGCACCRRVWSLLTDERSKKVIEVTERLCDNRATYEELADALVAATEAAECQNTAIDAVEATCFELAIQQLGFTAGVREAAASAAYGASCTFVRADSGCYIHDPNVQAAERNAQATLLREIFGNPFRPAVFDTGWRTTDVMLVANDIYEERAFDRMPILADALQDAGCDSDELLNHLRDTRATHVRGCWALDLVLGKE